MIKFLKKSYLGLILLFLYAPIFILIFFSFNAGKSRAVFSGFTFHWYIKLFNDRNIQNALFNTISIALLAAIIATAIGTFTSIGIFFLSKKKKNIYLGINNIPVVNPDIVTGISLMILYISFFKLIGIGKLGYGTILISHVMFCIPYVILSVLPRLKQMNKNLFEASMDLGATPFYTIIHVIIPELKPAIISGAILAFTLSLDDFVISFFTTGSGVNTLSILIYSLTRRGIKPEINALSTIMFVSIMVLLIIVAKLQDKTQKNS
ncbi:MAG: ABC transporter permease [Lachnospirales bacterium]